MRNILAVIKNALIGTFTVLLGVNGILMVIIATLQILSRAAGRPVAWTVEVLTFLGLYSILPGTAVLFLKKEEVEVSFFVNALPKRLALWISRIIALIGALFGGVLIYSNLVYRGLVNLGRPDQYLPFSPEVNTWPLYLLGICILWRMLEKAASPDRSTAPKQANSSGEL